MQRSEVEYYTCSIRAERARLEWESAIYKGTTCFQTLEEERLAALKQLVEKYHQNIKIAAPKLAEVGLIKNIKKQILQLCYNFQGNQTHAHTCERKYFVLYLGLLDFLSLLQNSLFHFCCCRQSASRLEEPVSQCDVEKDVATIINAKGTGENIPHQLLPDFYAEDINNIMNRERRREVNFIQVKTIC